VCAFSSHVDTLIEGLSNPERDRLKEDGGSLAGWLQNLALFAGLFFRKYTSVDLSPVIAYIYAQLNDDNTLDLVVLSELLQKMAGLESGANLTEQELEAQAGGPVLRAEVAQLQGRSVAAKGHRKPAQRLLSALVQSGKAVPLWVALGKLAFAAVYKTDIGHLKLLGLLTDQCHDVLLHYSQFFAPHAAENGLALDALPSVAALRAMGVELDYAFYMRRLWERSHADKSNLELLIAELAKGLPASVLLPACPSLCLTGTVLEAFWRLELQDLWVPASIYEGELARFRAIAGAAEAPLLASEADRARWAKDRERAPKVIASLETELCLRRGAVRLVEAWLAANRAALFAPSGSRTDIIAQLLHCCVLPRALFSPADALYAAKFLHALHILGAPNYSSLSCYDRIINGVAAQLVVLTEKEAHCYGRFLNEVLALLARWHASRELYEAEAIGEGRPGFLQKWSHSRKSADANEDEPREEEDEMRTEAESPAPSAMMMEMDSPAAVADSPAAVADSTSSLPESAMPAQSNNPLTYEDFRHVMYKWHLKLYRALLAAFQEGEYMPTRNAIILLSRTTAFFPALRKIGGSLERAIAKVAREEEGRREDLRLLATRLAAMFAAQKGRWVAESAFHRTAHPQADTADPTPSSAGVEASPKRSSAEAVGPDESQLERRVKRMRLEASEVDSNRSHSQTPVSSKEEAERELRRKLEERKRATESAAAASSSSASRPEKGKEKEKEKEAAAPKQSPTKGSRREATASKDTTSTGSRESSSRSRTAAPAAAAPPPPSSYSNQPTQSSSSSRQRPSAASDRDQHWRSDRYRDQDRRSSRR
jgi:THO complex subunit 2